MKKIAGLSLIALLLTLVTSFSSCSQTPGESKDYNDVVVEYNHTQYKFKAIQIGKGTYEFVYIMYPINDTTKGIPTVINYTIPLNKSAAQQATIVLK